MPESRILGGGGIVATGARKRTTFHASERAISDIWAERNGDDDDSDRHLTVIFHFSQAIP